MSTAVSCSRHGSFACSKCLDGYQATMDALREQLSVVEKEADTAECAALDWMAKTRRVEARLAEAERLLRTWAKTGTKQTAPLTIETRAFLAGKESK